MPITQSMTDNIHATCNLANYNPFYQSRNNYLVIPYQLYQSKPSQCAYQYVEEKGIYQIDSELTLENNKNNLNIYNTYLEKLQVNFVGIKSTYNRYITFFCSCSTLHNHIKARYNILKRVVSVETGSSSLSTRLILHFIVKLSVLGFGLVFRG